MDGQVEFYDKMTDPLKAIEWLGGQIYKSRLFQCGEKEVGGEAVANILALECFKMKKTPMELKQVFHVVNGNLVMRADAILAKFNERGGTHRWQRTDDKAAELLLSKGDTKDYLVAYTIDDGAKAGMCGPNGTMKPGQKYPGAWQKDPRAQLRARAASQGVRAVDPGAVAGFYTEEEVRDFDSGVPRGEPRQLFAPKAQEVPQEQPTRQEPSTPPPARNNAPEVAESPFVPSTATHQAAMEALPMLQRQAMPEIDRNVDWTGGLIAKLTEIGKAAEAQEFLRTDHGEKKAWLSPLSELKDLTSTQASKILGNLPGFLEAMNAAATPAPAQTVSAAPAVVVQAPAPAPAGVSVPEMLNQALGAILAGKEELATKWMVAHGKIKPGETWAACGAKLKADICARPNKFFEVISRL